MKDLMKEERPPAESVQVDTTDTEPQVAPVSDEPVDSPFGHASTSAGRILRWALYIAVPLIALAAVFLLRRESEEPAAAEHTHGSVAVAQGGEPVALSVDAANRIGVTYTTVSLGPLTREVRTVGQVTFDETRVKAIAPKIDGWVERLYVDFTGQPVAIGDPLLAIYSPMLVTAQ